MPLRPPPRLTQRSPPSTAACPRGEGSPGRRRPALDSGRAQGGAVPRQAPPRAPRRACPRGAVSRQARPSTGRCPRRAPSPGGVMAYSPLLTLSGLELYLGLDRGRLSRSASPVTLEVPRPGHRCLWGAFSVNSAENAPGRPGCRCRDAGKGAENDSAVTAAPGVPIYGSGHGASTPDFHQGRRIALALTGGNGRHRQPPAGVMAPPPGPERPGPDRGDGATAGPRAGVMAPPPGPEPG